MKNDIENFVFDHDGQRKYEISRFWTPEVFLVCKAKENSPKN